MPTAAVVEPHDAAADHNAPSAAAAPTPAPVVAAEGASAGASADDKGIAPEKALGWLKNGNTRYLKGWHRKDGVSASDRLRLAKGQHPHSVIVACSDSRVPPETIFDQVPGEVFVIRVVGEALDSSVIGSIEYAVEHLAVRNIVVLGHESCGAIAATLTTPPGASAGSPDMDRVVADMRPRMPANASPSRGLIDESKANAMGIAQDLLRRSSILSQRANLGKIKITPALFYLGSGKVEFYQ